VGTAQAADDKKQTANPADRKLFQDISVSPPSKRELIEFGLSSVANPFPRRTETATLQIEKIP
jgi:hypothetical protein